MGDGLPATEKTTIPDAQIVVAPSAEIDREDVEFETAKITRVIDGDTVEIEGGQKVRYIGIDTPETVDPRKPVQCFGAEASKKNKDLVEGKIVRMEKDVTDKDKYGRLLRYVYVGDDFINVEMVKQGFAYSYSYPPDIKFQNQILQAQQEAEAGKRGLWSACPLKNTSTPTSPASTTSTTSINSGCNIKGNISSAGEKIYHMEGCGSYSKTVIDESKGEKMFCSEAEAQSAGWRKALNCS
jgi:micrococcal nuclease